MKKISAQEYCTEKGILSKLMQFDMEENDPIDINTESYASHKRIWWQCERGHKWQSTISDHLMKEAGCPYCANKKVLSGFNDLATLYPDIVSEWNFDKNDSLEPDKVIAGSDRTVWWICEKGHEWKAAIGNRVLKKQNCPYCSGKRAWPGFNDLATLYPDLMKEWHPTLNEDLDPTRLRPASAKRAWWICSEGHVWETYIFNRTSKSRSGCPICAGNQKASKQAEWIAKALKKENELRKRRRPMNYELNYIMQKIQEPLICEIDGEGQEYSNGVEAIHHMKERYELQNISVKDGKVLVYLTKNKQHSNDLETKWAKDYKKETGVEPSFF